jgi:mannonate dehydratase
MALEQTWRWYGPNDTISLAEIKQTGATGIVNALHHIPYGELWSVEEILKRKAVIENAGFKWSVVESVPVHDDIKKRSGNYIQYIENYKQTLRNLSQCGIYTVCYNFMPVLDWSRTQLFMPFRDGSYALQYEAKSFRAFELFILKHSGDEANYTPEQVAEAKQFYESLSNEQIEELKSTVMQGLPGCDDSFTLKQLEEGLESYKGITRSMLLDNLKSFLREIIPVAEEVGVRMAIHPDDPPRPVLGLPRVVSNISDIKEILSAVDSPSNGLTLCTGSLGAGSFNDLPKIAQSFANRINFTHLRNVHRDADGNFNEDFVFEGDIDLYEVMKVLVLEEEKRKNEGRADWQIPLRPDHGNLMLGDIGRKFYPGYSLYGRMKGLAELRGLEVGIRRSLNLK